MSAAITGSGCSLFPPAFSPPPCRRPRRDLRSDRHRRVRPVPPPTIPVLGSAVLGQLRRRDHPILVEIHRRELPPPIARNSPLSIVPPWSLSTRSNQADNASAQLGSPSAPPFSGSPAGLYRRTDPGAWECLAAQQQRPMHSTATKQAKTIGCPAAALQHQWCLIRASSTLSEPRYRMRHITSVPCCATPLSQTSKFCFRLRAIVLASECSIELRADPQP